MRLYIKNMVCNRCKTAVTTELEKLALHPISVALGEVDIAEDSLPAEQRQKLSMELMAVGFELIDDKKTRLIEKIKTVIIDLIHYSAEPPLLKLSEYISQRVGQD